MSLTDNLQLGVRFDTTDWLDDSGNAFDLTGVGSPTVSGGGVVLNGSSQYLFRASNANLQGGNRDFSMFADFRIDSLAADCYICGKAPEYGLFYSQFNNQFRFHQAEGSPTQVVIAALTVPVAGNRYRFLCRYDAANNRRIIQETGACLASNSTAATANTTGAGPFEVGRYNGANYFPGRVYTVAFWDRLLDGGGGTAECTELENAGLGWEPPPYARVASGFDECGKFTGLREFDIRLFDSIDPTLGKRKSIG
jgi:hypothetical protein